MADEQNHSTEPITQQPLEPSVDEIARTHAATDPAAPQLAPNTPTNDKGWHLPLMVAGITVGALLVTGLVFGAGFTAGRATGNAAAGRGGFAAERGLDGRGMRGKGPDARGGARRGTRGQIEGRGGRKAPRFRDDAPAPLAQPQPAPQDDAGTQ